jgi:hypothetical protein
MGDFEGLFDTLDSDGDIDFGDWYHKLKTSV